MIAAYSPPMPAPARMRKTAKLQKFHAQPRGNREDEIDAERHHEELLAPEPVGQIPEEQRTADQRPARYHVPSEDAC